MFLKVYRCKFCEMPFEDEVSLKAHEKVCEKKCPYCEGKGYNVGYDDYDLYRNLCPHWQEIA